MVGSSIDHYKILQLIESGGMGVVYKAQDTRLGRFVAIKFLPPSLSAAGEEKRRFMMEARAVGALDHPNICTVYEINETEFGQMYLALAYYEGETLKTRIEKGPIESQEAIQIALQIARGLAQAHARGIIHRDIKPANIIITPEKIAKILDFGLAKFAASSRITHSHSTLGTVAYMPPEQARGDEVDHRADLWSLGVVLYEMITGHLPFRGEVEAALLYRITNEEPIPAQRWRPDLDPRLAAVLGRCLEKEPAERYQSTDELLHDLQICQQAEPEPQKEIQLLARPKRGRINGNRLKRRWRWLAGIAALSGLVTAALIFLNPQGDSVQQIPDSGKVIIFFPFTVSGSLEFTALREGMMDMLFISMDGTDGWRCIDPRIMMSQSGLPTDAGVDLTNARRISRSFGASHFLMGSLVVSHGRLRCNASLYTSATRLDTPVPVSAESREGDLTALADNLAIQVLTRCARAPADYLVRLGSMSTQSLPALKAYLEGLRKDRAGDIGGAYRLYTLATQHDSTFSLAWVRRWDLDQRWFENVLQAAIDIKKAVLYSEKLPLQERRMIWACENMSCGENEDAVNLTKIVLVAEPDNLLALSFLTTRWPLMANLYGHSVLETREMEKKLLALDPETVHSIEGISHAALKRGHRSEIDSLVGRFRELEHPHMPAWVMEMGRLYALAEWDQRPQLLQKALQQTQRDRIRGIENAVLFARDIAEARDAVRILVRKSEPLTVRSHGYMLLAAIEMGRGRRNEAAACIDTLATLLPEYENVFKGIYLPLHLTLFPDCLSNAEIEKIRQWQPGIQADRRGRRFNPIIQTQPDSRIPVMGWEFDFAPIKELLPHFRWYQLSLLSYFKGDVQAAHSGRQKLTDESVPPDAASLLRIWGNTLEALEEMKKGDHATALQFLEQESPLIRWPLLCSPIYSLAFPRFLRAELLHRLGRNEEALRWYRSLTELFIHDIPYRAPALAKLAEICQELGRPEEAAGYYEQFLFLWRDCDPDYKPHTAAASQRLQALKARRPNQDH